MGGGVLTALAADSAELQPYLAPTAVSAFEEKAQQGPPPIQAPFFEPPRPRRPQDSFHARDADAAGQAAKQVWCVAIKPRSQPRAQRRHRPAHALIKR